MADKTIYKVPVLIGASCFLVSQRELRNSYCTNRTIKSWSFYFLLKGLTVSGKIQQWIEQKNDLFEYLQCNEQTFRTRIKELEKLGLLEILPGYSLQLISYKKAATILGIDYAGLQVFNYDTSIKAKNTFSYMLVADEFSHKQESQRNALIHHIDKNPLLLDLLMQLLLQKGCNGRRLKEDPVYFQEQLLKLQEEKFKHGSDILTEIMERRADINRGVKKIAQDYTYKHIRSVTYLKQVMKKLGIIEIVKKSIISEVRSRRYVPAGTGKKIGYMWLQKAQATCWQLCDQIILNPNFYNNAKKIEPVLAATAA